MRSNALSTFIPDALRAFIPDALSALCGVRCGTVLPVSFERSSDITLGRPESAQVASHNFTCLLGSVQTNDIYVTFNIFLFILLYYRDVYNF